MNVAAANSRRRSFHFVATSLFGSQCRRQLSAAATYFATRRKKTEDLSGKTPILRTKVTKTPSSDARLMPLGSRGPGVRGRLYEKKRLSFLNRFFLWEQRESNPRPSACKADALNQLSYAPFSFLFVGYCVVSPLQSVITKR